ncbi:MAG: HupE/UreJ family protein [Gemmatimonadaceae bacterium]|nr:HupE/UreJ family protein [Gemmatimonadaceae bacterium]
MASAGPGAPGWRFLVRVAAMLLCLFTPASRLSAHEVPQRVAVRAFVQRDGLALRLLVRVPLEAMRDVDFPLRDDGSLDLVGARALLAEAAETWIVTAITITADGTALPAPRIGGARLALPNDRAFDSFAAARASFATVPLVTEFIPWKQALLDVQLDYTLPDSSAALVLHPNFATLGIRTTSVVRIVAADGTERVLAFDGNPESVALDPAWYDTAVQFTRNGFRHILGGVDHLLFVLCLIFPVRRWRSLVTLVTAFTLAHSMTLAASALGFTPSALWFPPLVEALIAASIVWLCIENVVLPEERLASRWPMAFAFGLVHGFGFSFALGTTLQFAGDNLVTALAAFNIGVELGQLLVLACALPVLWLARRHVGVERERLITIVGSVIVAHTAWHWLTTRVDALLQYRGSVTWPALDASFALGAMRVTLLAAVALAAALAMRQILRVPRRS